MLFNDIILQEGDKQITLMFSTAYIFYIELKLHVLCKDAKKR